MNEETKKPEQPTSEEPQLREVSEAKERPLREITKEQLTQILEAHRKWQDSEAKEGEKADLTDANLKGADLEGAYLVTANLKGADLSDANLQVTDLSEANLQGALLVRANLEGADLSYANLLGADLRETEGLYQEQLDAACGDAETKLPPGLSITPCVEEENE